MLKIPGTMDGNLQRTWEATTPNGQAWGRGSVNFRPQAQEPQWQAISLTDLPSLLLAGVLDLLGSVSAPRSPPSRVESGKHLVRSVALMSDALGTLGKSPDFSMPHPSAKWQ